MAPTFDTCLASFEAVVERSHQEQDRVGLFAAMYSAVTSEVRRCCGDGTFGEPVRMERFVAAFADRYFAAHDAWRDARPTTQSWVTAFEAATRWRPVVLQHVLLGMNAHINLDLGIVTADLAGHPEALAGLRRDFDAMNDVLASMVNSSQTAVTAVSPWIGLVDHLGARHDEALIRFSLRRARAQAWDVAQRLVVLPAAERPAEIARVDRAVNIVAARVLHPGATLTAGLFVVRLREPWSARRAVTAMRQAGDAATP